MMALKCLCMSLEESYRYGNGLSAIEHLNDSDHVCDIVVDDLLPNFGYYIVFNEKVYFIKKGYIYDSKVYYIATESEYSFDDPDYDAEPSTTDNNTNNSGNGSLDIGNFTTPTLEEEEGEF